MKNSTVNDCKVINFNFNNTDQNIEISNDINIPFKIKRVYYLYDIKDDSIRGEHAHKELYQVLIGLNGQLKIKIDDGRNKKLFNLKNPNQGLLIVPGIWRTLSEFSHGSICLVLASELYQENDYIRDYNEFLHLKK